MSQLDYSDASLLLMLASLHTVWAGGMATPFAPAGERDGALEVLARAVEAGKGAPALAELCWPLIP